MSTYQKVLLVRCDQWYPHLEHIELAEVKEAVGHKVNEKMVTNVYVQCSGEGYGAEGWAEGDCGVRSQHVGHKYTPPGNFFYWCPGTRTD